MTEEEIKQFENSTNEQHWNQLCDAIKRKYGGYPQNWYASIILSGVAARAKAKW